MNGFLQKLERAILDRQLIEPNQSVLVAISGGVDSMTLLHALTRLSRVHGWKLHVAHLNHRLRGRASNADEQLVRRAVKKLGVKATIREANVRSAAKQQKLSIEMAARQLRHEFLVEVAKDQKIETIALAHHADDQVELFFLRLLRGSRLEGLAGMDWSGPSAADPAVKLIRPFLDFSKADLFQWAKDQKVEFREDQTNRSLDFFRNRVRHELLPLLRRNYQPALSKTILRVMEIARAESQFMNQAANLPRRKRTQFGSLPAAFQRRILHSGLISIGLTPNFGLIEELRGSNAPVMIGPKTTVRRDGLGQLHLTKLEQPHFNSTRLEVSLSGGEGKLVFGGVNIRWSITPCKRMHSRRFPEKPASARSGNETFDADKIGQSIVLRHWQQGDRFQPIGMAVAAKLQDLFVNRKIPREERHKLLVLTTESGELVWVEGLRIAERFKLDNATVTQLKWSWHRA